MSGKVEGIWIKRAVGGVMDAAQEGTLVEAKGLEGDANFGRSSRQVTVIEKEVFDRLRAALPSAAPEMRRANFMVSGLHLRDSTGLVLSLGSARVLIKGETRPCERMDAQCPGLAGALDRHWGGGVHGIVLDGGMVSTGDPVTLEAAPEGGHGS